MENAIKKAIEGGYKNGLMPSKFTDKYSFWGDVISKSSENFMFYYSEILLDPTFWQALGKAEGWAMTIFETDTMGSPIGKIYWLRYWHLFIDHIAVEKDIDSFFTNLLSLTSKE